MAVLIASYFLYGKFLDKLTGVDGKAQVPSERLYDGVDYMPLPRWRIFLIQLLNIAGTGPIFGAILGACYGPVAFLWITIGGVLFGAMHDYMAGVISLRNDGKSLSEIIGKYLGGGMHKLSTIVIPLLMVLVGGVFIVTPSQILADKTDFPYMAWVAIIIIYYFVATILPIDKIIGKIYPIFGAALIAMAVMLFGVIVFGDYQIPELMSFANMHFNAENLPIIPTLFISIACGAISGFHATQSPLMARCMTNEKQGRPIFYGAMIAEGIVALIWAAAATYFFFDPNSGREGVDVSKGAAVIVDFITKNWLGTFGAVLAIMGVVFAPITSGDTALRSARLIVADFLNYDQKPIIKRLIISVPIFAVTAGLLVWEINDADGFDIIWRYFAWANQVLSVPTLWAITIYLAKKQKAYIITLIPALFMTMVCATFILIAQKEGFGLPETWAYCISSAVTLVLAIAFFVWKAKNKKNFDSETE